MMVPTSKCKIQPCRQVSANKSRYLFIDWKSPDQSKIQARSRNQLSMKLARDLNPHDSNSLFFLFQICRVLAFSVGYLAISWNFQGFITRFSVTKSLATTQKHAGPHLGGTFTIRPNGCTSPIRSVLSTVARAPPWG